MKPRSFVGELCIGIEIASSPLATLNDLGAGAVISDFGNNWGVVVGTAVSDWRGCTRSRRRASSTTDSSGAASPRIRHGPLGALAFTLAQMRAPRSSVAAPAP